MQQQQQQQQGSSPAAVEKPRRQRVKAWSTYKKLRILGAGASGQVFLVRRVTPAAPGSLTKKSVGFASDDVFVIKRIFLHGNDQVMEAAAVEVKVLQSLPAHPNIVGYAESFIDDEGYLNLVLECCPYGDLDQLLTKRREVQRPLSLKEVLFIVFQILVALRHLHAHGVMSRDVKPANLLISPFDPVERSAAIEALLAQSSGVQGNNQEEGESGDDDRIGVTIPETLLRDSSRCCIKLGDLGVAKVLESTHGRASTVVGTPHYISPAQCESQPYTTAADMWAAGCVIWELASTGEKLFGGANMLAVVQSICRGVVRSVPGRPEMDSIVLPLVRELVALDESARLTAAAAIGKYFAPRPGDTDWADDFEDPDEFDSAA